MKDYRERSHKHMIIEAPIRGKDNWGSGEYGASRGLRKHNGIDIACYKGSIVHCMFDGKVTKIGYPYDPYDKKKGHLRYVQVTGSDGLLYRYFYVLPSVDVDVEVGNGDVLGHTQGLQDIYPGITDHFHLEIKNKNGEFEDPNDYL